jgi:hypothetical protein
MTYPFININIRAVHLARLILLYFIVLIFGDENELKLHINTLYEWTVLSSSISRRVLQGKSSYVSEEHNASISFVAACLMLVRCLAYSSAMKREGYVPPKRLLTFIGLYGAISQKRQLFITTIVMPPNPALYYSSVWQKLTHSHSVLLLYVSGLDQALHIKERIYSHVLIPWTFVRIVTHHMNIMPERVHCLRYIEAACLLCTTNQEAGPPFLSRWFVVFVEKQERTL